MLCADGGEVAALVRAGNEFIASGSAALPLPSLRAQQALQHPLSEPPSVPSGGRRKAPLMAVPLPSLGAQLATSPPPPRDQQTRQSLLSAPRSPLSSKRSKNHSLTCRGRTSLLTQSLVNRGDHGFTPQPGVRSPTVHYIVGALAAAKENAAQPSMVLAYDPESDAVSRIHEILGSDAHCASYSLRDQTPLFGSAPNYAWSSP